MPSQVPVSVGTAYYSQHDTWPPLRRQLLNGDDTAIDLTNAATVTITIAHMRYSDYYSPRTPNVLRGPCNIEDPRIDGYVNWVPLTEDLHRPGTFTFIFEINRNDGSRQTVPAHTRETLVVNTKPGGFEQP